MLLECLAAALLAFEPQSLTISPQVINIPEDKFPFDKWPEFETDPLNRMGFTTLTIQYNVGPTPFPKNGKLQFMFGYNTKHQWHNNPIFDANFGWIQVPTHSMAHSPMGRWQLTNPAGIDYTTISAPSHPAGFIQKIIKKLCPTEGILEIQTRNTIPPNEIITIVVGDTSQGSPGLTLSWAAGHPSLIVMTDEDNNGIFNMPAISFPKVMFTGENANAFIVNIPMSTKVGSIFDVRIRAIQGRDETQQSYLCPVENFSGNIEITSDDPLATIPSTASFDPGNFGYTNFIASFGTPGYHWIKATIPRVAETATISNISECLVNDQDYRTYCGDMQRHSGEGGHAAIPDWMAWQNLFNMNDSFGTVVQHVDNVYAGFPGANKVAQLAQNFLNFNEKKFVTFPGYEWSLPEAHRHVVSYANTTDVAFSDDVYSGHDSPPPVLATTVAQLLTGLGSLSTPMMAIVHHPLWNNGAPPGPMFDWGPNLDDPVQRLVEIYSIHGSSERWVPGQTDTNYMIAHDVTEQRPTNELAAVADAVHLGYKFGFVGGSDIHAYVSCSDPEATSGPESYSRRGLGFVKGDTTISIANGLRDRIWEGLYNRRTYATTGAKIHLNWTANWTVQMGSSFQSPTATFNITAHSSGVTNRLDNSKFISLEIWRDGYDLVLTQTLTPTEDINIDWQDPCPINDGNEHAYYVRLVQDDTHIAWSSPIWWKL